MFISLRTFFFHHREEVFLSMTSFLQSWFLGLNKYEKVRFPHPFFCIPFALY